MLDDNEALQGAQKNNYWVEFTGYIDLSIQEVLTTNCCNLLSIRFSRSKTSSKMTSPMSPMSQSHHRAIRINGPSASQTLVKWLLYTSNSLVLILEPWGKPFMWYSSPCYCHHSHRQKDPSLQLTKYKEVKLMMETSSERHKPHDVICTSDLVENLLSWD